MALKMPSGGGAPIFSQGYSMSSGIEEAVIRNIHAVAELAEIVRTSVLPPRAVSVHFTHFSPTRSIAALSVRPALHGLLHCHSHSPCRSAGPNGRNKMVINHLEKLFVTSDAATIIRELEVVHPAGKVLVMASQQQEHEVSPSLPLQSSPPTHPSLVNPPTHPSRPHRWATAPTSS